MIVTVALIGNLSRAIPTVPRTSLLQLEKSVVVDVSLTPAGKDFDDDSRDSPAVLCNTLFLDEYLVVKALSQPPPFIYAIGGEGSPNHPWRIRPLVLLKHYGTYRHVGPFPDFRSPTKRFKWSAGSWTVVPCDVMGWQCYILDEKNSIILRVNGALMFPRKALTKSSFINLLPFHNASSLGSWSSTRSSQYRTVLSTLKGCLPSFKFASGAEIGDELRITDVENSTGTGIGFFKIFEENRLSHWKKGGNVRSISEWQGPNNILPSSSTLAYVKEEIDERLKLDHGSYMLEYEVDDGKWLLLDNDEHLASCIRNWRGAKPKKNICLRVLLLSSVTEKN
ncbi:hypothetical protein Tco_0041041 [Tanacetum coccineum]